MATVIISEVNLSRDYAEIKNTSQAKVNLNGWKLLDTTPTNQKRHKFIFAKDFWLAPGATVKIWSGVGKDDLNNIYKNRKAKIWNNSGDTAELYGASGNLVDSKTIGKPPNKGSRGPLPPKPPQGQSRIYGYVTDSVCKQLITNAHLEFKEGQFNKITDTDSNGYYAVNLPAGRYNTTITAPNYDKIDGVIVSVQVNHDVKKDFSMTPNIEIELGVDSTDVKFTRKDDNLVNAIKQLTNKITVDINTNYTFTVKLAITKGIANEVRATLLENGKNPNKIPNTKSDYFCRISDDNKILSFEFNPVKNNWKWYKLDGLTVASSDKTEKSYDYSISLVGSYGNNKYNRDVKLGKIIVKVNKDKFDALFWYNIFLIAEGGFFVAFVIAAVVAVILAWPALAELLLLEGSLTAAGISGAIAGLLDILTGVPKTEKEKNLRLMDDPPQFDGAYKKLVVVPRKVHTPKVSIKRFSAIRNAMITSRDRIYSAYLKKDKIAVTNQIKHFKKLLKENRSSLAATVKYIDCAVERIKKSKIFTLETISKVRNLLRQNKVPKKLILAKVKEFKVSKAQIGLALKTIKNRKIKDKELLVLPKFKKLSSDLTKSNNLFEKNILKEIRWYSKTY